MLEVSVEQPLLSEFILRSVLGGVTPSTIPYMTDEFLAKVHQTPSVTCGPPLRSLSRPHSENPLRSQPYVDHKRHDTYVLLTQWCAGPPCGAYPVLMARTSRIPLGVDNGVTRHLLLTYGLSIHGSLYLTLHGLHTSSQRSTSRLYGFPILRLVSYLSIITNIVVLSCATHLWKNTNVSHATHLWCPYMYCILVYWQWGFV